MREEYVVVEPTVSETRPDLADPAAEFCVCLRELQAQGDHAVAFLGGHEWAIPSVPHLHALTQIRHRHAVCRHPIGLARRWGKAAIRRGSGGLRVSQCPIEALCRSGPLASGSVSASDEPEYLAATQETANT